VDRLADPPDEGRTDETHAEGYRQPGEYERDEGVEDESREADENDDPAAEQETALSPRQAIPAVDAEEAETGENERTADDAERGPAGRSGRRFGMRPRRG